MNMLHFCHMAPNQQGSLVNSMQATRHCGVVYRDLEFQSEALYMQVHNITYCLEKKSQVNFFRETLIWQFLGGWPQE